MKAWIVAVCSGACGLVLILGLAGDAAARSGRRTFFANDRDSLLEIDRDSGKSRRLMALPDRTTDIARSPDGTLYACTEEQLLRLDLEARSWEAVGPFGVTVSMNALSFADDGALFGAAWDGGIYQIHVRSGAADLLGHLPGGWESAGDLVVLAQGRLLLTAHHDERTTDRLAWFDLERGEAELGADTGMDRVYGLSLLGRDVVLINEDGDARSVDPHTGTTRKLFRVRAAIWGVEERL